MSSILYTNKLPNEVNENVIEGVDELLTDSGREFYWKSVTKKPLKVLEGFQSNIKRKVLMDEISEFITSVPIVINTNNSSVNLLEAIRYSLFFQSEKYKYLVSIVKSNKNKEIRFDVLGYDLNLLLKLFARTKTVHLFGINSINKFIVTFRGKYHLLKSILIIIIKWSFRNRKMKFASLNEIDFIFTESSLRNVWYADQIASELEKKGKKTLLLASKSVQNQTYNFLKTAEPVELLEIGDIWKIIRIHFKVWRWYKKYVRHYEANLDKRTFLLISFNLLLDSLVWQQAFSKFSNNTCSKLISTSIAFSGTRIVTLNFRKKKLNTYLIQHGLTFTFDFEKHILQEYQIMWGEYNRKQLIKYEFDINKIYTTGSIKYGKSLNQVMGTNNYVEVIKVVFFPSRTAGAYVSLSEAQIMLKYVMSLPPIFPKINLKIKCHPEDNSYIFDDCKELLLDNKVKSLDLLQKECIVIASTSTVGLEACCLGKDMIIIENETIKDVTQLYREYGAALVVNNELELQKAMDDILTSEKIREQLKIGRLRLVKDMFSSSNRVLEKIVEVLIDRT